jgi:hypothetical protein
VPVHDLLARRTRASARKLTPFLRSIIYNRRPYHSITRICDPNDRLVWRTVQFEPTYEELEEDAGCGHRSEWAGGELSFSRQIS